MRILFVCMGNICRSPTAEAVLRHLSQRRGLAARVQVDSAGTGDWHVGKAPDARSQSAARARGYELANLRARQVADTDFEGFDLILAMDRDNLERLRGLCPEGQQHKLDLFAARYGLRPAEVPDPYYGGQDGFERVLDLLEAACERLLDEIEACPAMP